jgi:hypothetical protein
MINFKDYLDEGKRGLWDNIHAKRKRIKAGSGEKMRKPGSKGAPTDADFKAANEEVVGIDELNKDTLYSYAQKANNDMSKKHKELTQQVRGNKPVEANKTSAKLSNRDKGLDRAEKRLNTEEVETRWILDFSKYAKKPTKTDSVDKNHQKILDKAKTSTPKKPKDEYERKVGSYLKKKYQKEEVEQQFDLIEEVIEELALAEGADPEFVWETLEFVTDEELLEYAIDKKGHKSSTGGLTQKGVDAYNAKTGGNLQTAVTTKPSKLKPGSKAANRRKSFCARMGGVDGPMKKPNGEPTRKALALRKWNC